MANRDTPNGFTPVGMLDGSEIPCRDFLATSLATALYIGDLVSAQANGDVEPSAADDGDIVLGAVVALYDTNGIPAGHPSSDISTKYLASGDSGIAKVALALPGSVFQVQADDGGGTALAATDVFRSFNHIAGSGSTTTARSGHEIDISSTTTTAQFKIIDKVDEPNNAWGASVDLLVVPQESFWFDGTNGV